MTKVWGQPIPAEALLKIVQSSVFSFFCHLVILMVGFATFDPHIPMPTKLNFPTDLASTTLSKSASETTSAWYHWDSLWFVHIAQYGYEVQPSPMPEIKMQSNVAFMPGLPIVMRLLQPLGISPWAGVLVLNTIADFLAKLGLGLIAYRLTQSTTAAIWSILIQLCWPWNFFLVAPYQEAIGLACVTWSVEFGLRRRFMAGAFLACLAGAFRLNAVGFFAGLATGSQVALFKIDPIQTRLKWLWLCSGAIISWLALNFYFFLKFGDASIGMTAQLAWNRSSPHPWNIVLALFEPIFNQNIPGSTWLHWAVAWCVLISIAITWKKLGPVWAMPVAAMTAQCLATRSVMSFGRFTLLALPFFITAGLLAERKPRFALALCLPSLLLQCWLLNRYGHDFFAG